MAVAVTVEFLFVELLETPVDPLDLVTLLFDVLEAFQQILATVNCGYALPSFLCTTASSASTDTFVRSEALVARDRLAGSRSTYSAGDRQEPPRS